MSFRTRLILLFTLTIALTVGLVAAIVSSSMTRAYERMDEERSAALVNQFRQEFNRRATEITRRVETMASSDDTVRLAVEMSRSAPDYSQFVNEARRLNTGQLDLFDIVAQDGTIVSSEEWSARFGYTDARFAQSAPETWTGSHAFLDQVNLPEGPTLGIITVRTLPAGDRYFYLVGGDKVDQHFLASLSLPKGMEVKLYRRGATSPSFRPVAEPQEEIPLKAGKESWASIKALLEEVEQQRHEAATTVQWRPSGQSNASATFYASPLFGRTHEVLGVLLIGSSQQELLRLNRRIRWASALVAAGGILGAVLLSTLLAGRVTKPVEELAVAADEVAAGNLGTRVDDSSQDEIGRLAYAFNRMTRELLEQREKLVQTERVAAWRELARRLAHELKNPLFPLQITVENLLRAREHNPEQFEEVFKESTETLLTEIANLKTIIARFSDFSRMPAPQMQPVLLNDAVKKVVRVYEPQFCSKARPPVTLRYELDPKLDQASIMADPDLLHRALSNLVLNALDAMTQPGHLTLRTQDLPSSVRISVADTGVGLTPEECKRLFTPYYTSKQYGTGLGLAIVQSVVSDHGGKIWANSEPAKGTEFVMELPKPGCTGIRDDRPSPPSPRASS